MAQQRAHDLYRLHAFAEHPGEQCLRLQYLTAGNKVADILGRFGCVIIGKCQHDGQGDFFFIAHIESDFGEFAMRHAAVISKVSA